MTDEGTGKVAENSIKGTHMFRDRTCILYCCCKNRKSKVWGLNRAHQGTPTLWVYSSPSPSSHVGS